MAGFGSSRRMRRLWRNDRAASKTTRVGPRENRRRWGRRAATVAAVLGASTIAAVAYADNLGVDGDTTVSPPNISYTVAGTGNSHACSTRGTAVPGLATINFQGSTHLTAGETVTVATTPDAAAVAAGITVTGGTATVPTPWSSGGSFTRSISTLVPVSAGDGSYTVTVGG